jgi:hypothetical protein
MPSARQNHRIGALLARGVGARNRGVGALLYPPTLRMLHTMRQHAAAMPYAGDQIEAELTLPPASPLLWATNGMAENCTRWHAGSGLNA